jgi:hypothetical protein
MGAAHTKNWITSTRREAIYARDGHCCVWCGCSVSRKPVLGVALASLDHVVCQSVYPVLMGHRVGMNASDNLVTACQVCNSARKDLHVEVFAAKVAAYRGETVDAVLNRVRSSARLVAGERAPKR